MKKLLGLLLLLFLFSCTEPGTIVSGKTVPLVAPNGDTIDFVKYCPQKDSYVWLAFVRSQPVATMNNSGQYNRNYLIILPNKKESIFIVGNIILQNDSIVIISKTR